MSMNLTKLRQARGLSQKALGELIGVDASTINRAEKMHPTAKLQTYRLCADAFGVTLADVLADDRTELENALLAAFRRVPENKRDEVLAMIRLARAQD